MPQSKTKTRSKKEKQGQKSDRNNNMRDTCNRRGGERIHRHRNEKAKRYRQGYHIHRRHA